MQLVYNHLNQETSELLEQIKDLSEKKSKKIRFNWINTPHFVFHDKARKTIDCLNEIYAELENIDDLSEMEEFCNTFSITGGTGTGKTATALEFMRQHPPSHNTEKEFIPISRALLRDGITGLTGLYYSLLEALGSPNSSPPANKRSVIRIANLENQLLWALKTAGVKILIADEFQHLIGRNQQSLVNQLKRTLQFSKVAFIPMGTPIMRDLIELDPQLSDRCQVKPYTKFHNWKSDKEFLEFLGGYEKFLPFDEKSNLKSSENANLIFEKVIRFEYKKTGELLTYKKFKDWIREKKKQRKSTDLRAENKWRNIEIDDNLYENMLNDGELKEFVDPENELVIRTNLRRVTTFIKKIARRGLLLGHNQINGDLINEIPY
ncbi:MAG: TniB family NTP-binding protein [Candidatus Hodarchaeota archaeon]